MYICYFDDLSVVGCADLVLYSLRFLLESVFFTRSFCLGLCFVVCICEENVWLQASNVNHE